MASDLSKTVEAAIILARRGMLRPGRPDRIARQLLALHRWGTTIAAAYAGNAARIPDQVAVIDDRRSVTFAETEARTNALARGLGSLSLKTGKSTGVLCHNSASFVETVIAASKLGANALLLNTSFSTSELKAVMQRERPRVLVYDDEFEKTVSGAGLDRSTRLVLAEHEGDEHQTTLEQLIEHNEIDAPPSPEDEERVVILTSGTTGTPKGARLARARGLGPLAWFLSVVPINARSVYLIPAPLFHAHGYGQFATASALSCTVILPRRFDAEHTLALVDRHRVNVLAAVPTMLKRIMDLDPKVRARYDCSSLSTVVCSGSALPRALARSFTDEFGPVIYNLYGSTELAYATIATPQDLLEAEGTVGRPPPHTRLAILNESGRPLPPNRTGRIFVGHELLFDGYTDDSGETPTADGMMSAGDLGHMDEQGRLFIDSREDDMIVSGGENVYPGEVEEVLRAHPEIDDVAVLGVEDEEFGERLVAFVAACDGSSLSPQDVKAFAKQNLARFKVPREVEIRDDLPRNALGKVLKRELRTTAAPSAR